MSKKVLIIGAGLTGLATAYYLRKAGLDIHLLEARARLGGRIHTIRTVDGVPIEMGATWLGKKHNHLTGLLEELGIGIAVQELGTRAIYEPLSTSPPQWVQLPPNEEPSYRIEGGSARLIDLLAGHLTEGQIHLKTIVRSISYADGAFLVRTDEKEHRADLVVSTLPPKLLVDTIRMDPTLPEDVLAVAGQTHTWMGESIKVALSFKEPFWRKAESSGTLFSNVGPIPEMYDHSTVSDGHFALKGFFNSAFHSLSREERRDMVLGQLRKYYGDVVDSYASYEERVWRDEPFTFEPYAGHVLPHQHNGHTVFRQSFYDGGFFLGGSETAAQFPGYMDGAVQCAQWIAAQILPSN